MKKDWMAELASHYRKIRQQYPEDRLMILFDIDGTIIDMRYMVFHVLKAYDREHSNKFFQQLKISNITVHENQVDLLLSNLEVPPRKQKEIIRWYHEKKWSSEFILNSHRPFTGVLEVIRWFQIQPNTFVGINTGRPESLREDTLKSLNRLGKEYKVQFTDELLHMNPFDWEQNVADAKVAGVHFFQEQGYRIFRTPKDR